MSYEGYQVILCANGHRRSFDCYDTPQLRPGLGQNQWDDKYYSEEKVWHCPDCGELSVWCESVDQTNGEGSHTVLKEYKPTETSTCEHCGLTKQLKPVQYYIPSNYGRRINPEVGLKVPTAKCEYYNPEEDDTIDLGVW